MESAKQYGSMGHTDKSLELRKDNSMSRSHSSKTEGHILTRDIDGERTELLENEIKSPPPSLPPERSSSQKTVALAGACLNVMIGMGFPFSVGALYVEMINIYNASRSEAAVVQSLTVGFLFGAGIIAGMVVDRYGVRVTAVLGGTLGFLGLFTSWFTAQLLHLMITVGVVTGFGSSLVYMSSSVIVTRAFGDKGRRLAMPGLVCAGGVGSVMFPELLDRLLREYGLKGTLVLISCFYLNTIPCGLIITSCLGVQPKKATKATADDTSGISIGNKLSFLKMPIFLIFVFTSSIAFGCMNGLGVVLLDFIQSRGYPANVGLGVLLICNSVNTVSRLGSGFFKLIPRVSGVRIFAVSLILCSTAMMLLRNTSNYSVLLILIVIFSIGFGGVMGIFPFTILEYVGPELFPLALGFTGLFSGSANPIGSTLMGFMYDLTKSYELPFLIYGILGNCAAVIMMLTTLNNKLCHPKMYTRRTGVIPKEQDRPEVIQTSSDHSQLVISNTVL